MEITNISQISSADIQGMDLETAMMAVQSNRSNALETQLRDQMTGVQNKNAQIAKLNQALNALNGLVAKFPADMKVSDKIGEKIDWGKNSDSNWANEMNTNKALQTAGVAPFGDGNGGLEGGLRYTGGITKFATKGDVETAIQSMKTTIDGLSNTQQTDMLRLQSISGKRNEAFDVMTTFMKKQQDSRSSVVGNMR